MPAQPPEPHASSRLDFSFDQRVVGQYDALRGHPPQIALRIGQVLLQALQPAPATLGSDRTLRPLVLELGVGTGRIALPVAAAGAEVIGIDLSAEMLATLQAQPSREAAAITLIRGDITALPFRAQVFDAAMATHVLHLVGDWTTVLRHLAEVVKPHGALLLGRDWVDPGSMAGQIRRVFREAVMQQGFKTAAPAGGESLHRALLAIGAQPVATGPTEIIAAEWQATLSPAEVLAGIRSRDDAESWVLPDEILEPVCTKLTAFVAAHWPDEKTPQEVLRRFMLSVYRTADPNGSASIPLSSA